METDPKPVDSMFVVKTAWVQGKDTVSVVKAGELLELRVYVKAKKKAEYVIIELPIPAGCS